MKEFQQMVIWTQKNKKMKTKIKVTAEIELISKFKLTPEEIKDILGSMEYWVDKHNLENQHVTTTLLNIKEIHELKKIDLKKC